MHILFLSHYFPPEVNAPASRTYENTKRWVKAGHKVTVITCSPNHPRGILYPGYKNKLRQSDEKDGINILRVKTYLSANKGILKRTLNYISFMISASLQCYKVKNVDIVVSTSPQFFCGMAGYFVSRIKAKPWILEIRDLWPESIIAVGAIKKHWMIDLLEKVETLLYKHADHIVCLTKAFKRHITGRGIFSSKITIITNGADLQHFAPLPKNNSFREQYHLNGKFVASYVGTHGLAHSLETVLFAAEVLRNDSNIKFLLVGDGAVRENLLELKEDKGLANVIMLTQQQKDKVPEIIAASDACMVLLRKTDLFKTVLPSKMFEAMAMQRPIILGVDGESREMLDTSQGGIFIEPENYRQLAETVKFLCQNSQLCNEFGNNGRRWVVNHCSRDHLADDYLHLIERVKWE